MEVKVYVDGIQRVVCGATWDTSCQDVVIALAHALGRTGRFTLIEKWRDNERPLTPAECPLQVLHKWGEYAAEVRFILCQADSDRRVSAAAGSQERLVRRGMEKSVSLHRIVSPQTQGPEPSVKRSLTFSGAHNQPVEGPAWMSAAMPTSKLRKTQQGPVPDGDLRLRSGVPLPPHHHPHPHPHSHHHPLHSSTQVRQVKGIGGSGTTQSTALSSSSSSSDHPHHRCPSPSHGGEQQGGSVDLASSTLPSVLSHRQLGDASRPSAFQPPKNLRSRAASPPKCSAAPEGFGRPQPQPQSRLELQPSTLPLPSPDSLSQPSSGLSGAHPQAGPHHPHPHSLGLAREPQVATTHLPSSPTRPLPDHPPHPHPQSSSLPAPHKASDATSTVPDPGSPQDGLQIEEYDLDHNFPGSSHKDWNHNEAPLDSLEYRLEEGLGSGTGSGSGGHLEGEHAKLLRLVNMQQQRLKTQESQIGLVNTEISNLEEKEMEYEENLHVIMEELLLQENRQRELEPQLHELDKVNWETAAEEEKKTEIDLTLQVASCKATVLDQEAQLDEVRSQERRLLQELRQEEDGLAQEKARLEQEESEARAEESRAQEEIDRLEAQASQLQETSAENQASLDRVEGELASVEEALKEKEEVAGGLEADLKEENLKELAGQAVSEVGVKASDSQNVLRRILEDTLSPRGLNAGGFHSEGAADTPLPGPALLAAFATSNQSGVWV